MRPDGAYYGRIEWEVLMIRRFVALSALSVAAAAGPVAAQAPSFAGIWHWNKAQSALEPGEPAPRDILLQITEAANGKLKWTVTETDPEGGKHVESFDGPADGTAQALTGGDGHTTAAFTLSGDSLAATFKGQDGGSDAWSCTLSGDQRRMTCKGTESDGKGHAMSYADVYDRG
jgi:hypothetical protein